MTSTRMPRKSFVDKLIEIFGVDMINGFSPDSNYYMSHPPCEVLSRNPNVSIADVVSHPEIHWDDFYVKTNLGITIDYVIANLDKYEQNEIAYLSDSPNITMKDIFSHPEIKWNQQIMSGNPSLTIEDVITHPEIDWDFYRIYQHPNIRLEDIEAVKNKLKITWPPNALSFSANPNITMKHFLEHPDFPWDFHAGLELNPNFTFEELETIRKEHFPHCVSHFVDYTSNPNITKEIFIANQKEKDWSYCAYLMNPAMKFDQAENFQRYSSADYQEHTRGFSNEFEDYIALCCNPNLTLDEIKKIVDKIKGKDKNNSFDRSSVIMRALYGICCNQFFYHPYFRSSHYRRRETKRCHDQMYSELIARACVTSHIFSWNEGAADEMPEAYAEECRRWREMKFVKA